MSTPKITVIMAVYNNATYLKHAIDSILQQTFQDLELLVVDDGSTDGSGDIIKRYSDPRIRLLENPVNKGVIYSRNRALKQAKGKFIAILDSDDMAVKDRLDCQYEHLMKNRLLAMTGGHAEVIDLKGFPTGELFRMPISPDDVSVEMLFRNVFVNSSVMVRKEVMEQVGGYREIGLSEDYDLAFRINERCQVDNLDKILVQYRVHADNISAKKTDLMLRGEEKVVQNMHASLGISPDIQLQKTHLSFIRGEQSFHPELLDYFHLFEAIKNGNDRTGIFPKSALDRYLLHKWYHMIRESDVKNPLSLFLKPPLYHSSYVTFKMYRKIIKKAVGFG